MFEILYVPLSLFSIFVLSFPSSRLSSALFFASCVCAKVCGRLLSVHLVLSFLCSSCWTLFNVNFLHVAFCALFSDFLSFAFFSRSLSLCFRFYESIFVFSLKCWSLISWAESAFFLLPFSSWFVFYISSFCLFVPVVCSFFSFLDFDSFSGLPSLPSLFLPFFCCFASFCVLFIGFGISFPSLVTSSSCSSVGISVSYVAPLGRSELVPSPHERLCHRCSHLSESTDQDENGSPSVCLWSWHWTGREEERENGEKRRVGNPITEVNMCFLPFDVSSQAASKVLSQFVPSFFSHFFSPPFSVFHFLACLWSYAVIRIWWCAEQLCKTSLYAQTR